MDPGEREPHAGGAPEPGFFLAVHAGAGFHSHAKQSRYRAALSRACIAGAKELRAGLGARAAVVAAVKTLEEEPLTNAGLGSNLTADGRVECDASVMDGLGNLGAVRHEPQSLLPSRMSNIFCCWPVSCLQDWHSVLSTLVLSSNALGLRSELFQA